jgi:hypothetical protein
VSTSNCVIRARTAIPLAANAVAAATLLSAIDDMPPVWIAIAIAVFVTGIVSLPRAAH